jgi:hypothetical protein
MKKQILIISFILFSLSSQSQVLISLLLGDKLNSPDLEFGLEGGLNWANISGMETNDYARFFNLGFYFDFRVKNQWGIYTGVLVKSNLGVDKLTENDLAFLGVRTYPEEGDYKQVINQFQVPAFAKYKFKNHIYVEAGPEFGLRFKGYVQYDSKIDDIEAQTREDNKDMLQKLDVGVGAGIGYKLLKGQGWTVGAKYYYGFVDVYKDRPGTKSSSINLKLNIPIGAGASKEKTE